MVFASIRAWANGKLHDQDIDMRGRVVIVTGANAGLGLYMTKAFVTFGAHVIMACRSVSKAEDAANEIRAQQPSSSSGKITVLPLDLADMNSVNKFVELFNELKLPLHILVTNAGFVGSGSKITMKHNGEDLEPMFVTNHLGHYLLTEKLLVNLKRDNTEQNPGRLVIVSSEMHFFTKPVTNDNLARFTLNPVQSFFPYTRISNDGNQYNFTKLCNVYHAHHLADRFKEEGVKNIIVTVSNPGPVRTNFRESMDTIFWKSSMYLMDTFFSKDVEYGASTMVWAATTPELTVEDNGAYLNDMKVEPPSELAKDKQLRNKLIELSEEYLREYL